MAPDHKSILSELVRRYTSLNVFEVEDGMRVQANCVYIIPPQSEDGRAERRAALAGADHTDRERSRTRNRIR